MTEAFLPFPHTVVMLLCLLDVGVELAGKLSLAFKKGAHLRQARRHSLEETKSVLAQRYV